MTAPLEAGNGAVSAGSAGDSGDPLIRLARESGRTLGELGVRPDDAGWIHAHAEAIESLERVSWPPRWPRWPRGGIRGALYRLARKAARTAR